MYCAECSRCGSRTLLEDEAVTLKQAMPETPDDLQATPAQLRCDMCGSKKVKLTYFDSRYEALAYTLRQKK